MPIVSVVMPVYNGKKYLGQALDSILRQSFDDFELIVINDGSTDDSGEILSAYARKDGRIVVIEQPNLGIVSALNQGIELARGKYIARMDADDIAMPDRFAAQFAFMQINKNVVVCGTNYVRFGNSSGEIRTAESDDACRCILTIESCFAHPTVMMRSEIIKAHGLKYRAESEFSEDYRLWSELSEFGEFRNIQRPLLNYRVHGGQTSEMRMNAQRLAHAAIAENNLRRAGLSINGREVARLLWPNERGSGAALRYAKEMRIFRKQLDSVGLVNIFLKKRLIRIRNKNLAKILVRSWRS